MRRTRPSDRPPSAFQSHNYRLYFVGQTLSNVGTWFQTLAQGLLVLELTGKGASLGIATALQFLPSMVFGAWAGVVLDRVSVRAVIVVMSIVAGAQALALGVLVSTGTVTVGWVYALAFVGGCATMFDRPSSQAILPELVERDQIANAVSLNTVTTSVGRLAGPAIGGLVYAWQGAAACFYANAVSFVVVMVAVLLMRRSEMLVRARHPRERGQVRRGLRYVQAHPALRELLVVNGIVGLLAFNFFTTVPAMVVLTFHDGSGLVGVAHALNAALSLLGGVVLARSLRRPTRRMYALSCLVFGVALAAAAAAPTIEVFLASMGLLGLGFISYQTVSGTFIQQHTQPEYLGRVSSLYFLGVIGTTPIGALLTGWLIDEWSPRAAMGLGAITLLACGAFMLLGGRALDRARVLGEIDVVAAERDAIETASP